MSRMFLGGVPTGPEVDRLIKEIEARAGVEVTYEQVERITGVRQRENRFRSVTAAWRKRMFREKGIEVKAEGGRFLMLTPDEALSSGISSFHKAGRALGRTSIKISVINETELAPARAETKRLLQRELDVVTDAARRAAKAIAAPKPVAASQRIAPAHGDAEPRQ